MGGFSETVDGVHWRQAGILMVRSALGPHHRSIEEGVWQVRACAHHMLAPYLMPSCTGIASWSVRMSASIGCASTANSTQRAQPHGKDHRATSSTRKDRMVNGRCGGKGGEGEGRS